MLFKAVYFIIIIFRLFVYHRLRIMYYEFIPSLFGSVLFVPTTDVVAAASTPATYFHVIFHSTQKHKIHKITQKLTEPYGV